MKAAVELRKKGFEGGCHTKGPLVSWAACDPPGCRRGDIQDAGEAGSVAALQAACLRPVGGGL